MFGRKGAFKGSAAHFFWRTLSGEKRLEKIRAGEEVLVQSGSSGRVMLCLGCDGGCAELFEDLGFLGHF